jgi:hypothetical protein
VKPIVIRGANGVTVFLPTRRQHPGRFALVCLNDKSVITGADLTAGSLRNVLVQMAQKAVALNGAIQQIVQLDI